MKLYIRKLNIIILIILFIGCEDYLDRYPISNPSDDTFLVNATELELAVSGCYNILWWKHGGIPFHLNLDFCSDIGWDRNATPLQAIGRSAQDSRNQFIIDFWSTMYKGIARCNYVLEGMTKGKDKIPESFYQQCESEVRFLRAFYYSYLVELYGGVPLVTNVLSLSTSQVPRNTKEEVVNFILSELEGCADYLPYQNKPVSGRATKGAAWALGSRIALYNEKWDIAISFAQKVMDLEGTEYELHNNYMDLFQYAGQNSKEIIFSIQHLKGYNVHNLFTYFGSRNAFGYTDKIPAYQLSDSWECIDGLQIDESPLFDPQQPYKNRDPRLGFTLAVSGSTFLGFQFETHGDSIQCWNYNLSPPQRVANLDATHAYATFSGICWRKYADNADRSARNQSDLNITLIRYAEVLLNYAEAKIESGSIDNSVLEAINKVRQRPSVNMPPIISLNSNELRNAVRRERKYELSCEGFRTFDIRRWKIAENVMNLPVLGRMKKSYPDVAPTIDELGTAYYDNIPIAIPGESADYKMRTIENRTFNKNRDYLWPIPYNEMETNSKMVQNPNY